MDHVGFRESGKTLSGEEMELENSGIMIEGGFLINKLFRIHDGKATGYTERLQ